MRFLELFSNVSAAVFYKPYSFFIWLPDSLNEMHSSHHIKSQHFLLAWCGEKLN